MPADPTVPPADGDQQHLRRALMRVVLFAAALVALAWFLQAATLVLLVLFISIVAAVALNVPIAWLEQRRVPRPAGTAIVLAVVFTIVAGIAWLVGPRVLEQLSTLVEAIPEYVEGIEERSDAILGRYPMLDDQFEIDAERAGEVLPSLGTIASQVGRYSIGLLTFVILAISSIAMVIYMLLKPRPLLRGMLRVTPERHRAALERSMVRFSRMVVGWLGANAVVGTIEAVLVAIVLSLLGVPGAIVWASLAFFAELVPRIGPYIMAGPPVIVALAVDPVTALWVVLFYTVMNEFMSDVVTPRIQGESMDIHPVYLLLAVLVFGSAFGLVGALAATPLAAAVAAFWHEFYVCRQPEGDDVREGAERIIDRRDRPEGGDGGGGGGSDGSDGGDGGGGGGRGRGHRGSGSAGRSGGAGVSDLPGGTMTAGDAAPA